MDDAASFTVRLVNQVTAPANAIKRSMGDVAKAVTDAQKKLDAPAAKRGALSDWDKMVASARRSQSSDFAKAALKKPDAKKPDGSFMGTLAGVVTGEAIVGVLEKVGDAEREMAFGAAEAVAKLGEEFFKTATEAAMFAEKSTLAIGFLTDNAQQAGNTFDMVRHEAQSLGLEVDNTVGGFEKLLAAQFNVGQSKALIKMGADMQAIGASAEEVQRIIYAMTEIKSIGSLQKRQERMLQMAGISGQLIDKALMQRTGIKDKAHLDKARKGNQIGADDAIEAIKDAVMMKTHEKQLGDAGKQFADTTLAGMKQKLEGGIGNWFTDAGLKLLPGLTTIATLVSGTIGKIMNDPMLQHIGRHLLESFELFVLWLQANWPTIESVVITGLQIMGAAIMVAVDNVDALSEPFRILKDVALGAGAALLLFLDPIDTISAAIERAGEWLGGIAGRWYQHGKDMIFALIDGIESGITQLENVVQNAMNAATFGLVPAAGGADHVVGSPAVAAGRVTNSLAGADAKTEGGHQTTGHTIHIGELALHFAGLDGDDAEKARKMGAMVRAEIEKALHQVAA